MFLALCRRCPVSLALVAALTFAFATPTWSVSANGLWTHPLTQLGIAGGAYALSRDRWWAAGIFLALGMLGRPHVALIAAVIGLGAAVSRRQVRPLVAVAIPCLGALGFLEVWNRIMFGAWSLGGGAYGRAAGAAAVGYHGTGEFVGSTSQLENYAGFLVAPDRGFLVWTPVVLILIPALVRSWRSLPDWARWMAIGGVVYELVQLRINHFSGGEGFYGYRHGLELLTCLTPALGISLQRVRGIGLVVAPVLVATQFAAISIGAVAEGFFLSVDQMWTDNGFLLALRHQPAVVGIWLGLCLLGGVVVSAASIRRANSSPPAADALTGVRDVDPDQLSEVKA